MKMLVILSACATKEPKIKGFSRQTFIAQNIELTGQVKDIKAGQKLRVYIDGNAQTAGFLKKQTHLRLHIWKKLCLRIWGCRTQC